MLTTVIVHSGLPKMMSRVLVCLYTTDSGSLTASELVQRLQVSPASISKAITSLESLDLVRRERDERRRERYVVDDDLWYQSMMRSARDNAQLADTARQGVGILGPDTPAAARLDNIARYLDFVAESITRAAEQAREVLFTKAEATSVGTAQPSSDRWRGRRLVDHSQRTDLAVFSGSLTCVCSTTPAQECCLPWPRRDDGSGAPLTTTVVSTTPPPAECRALRKPRRRSRCHASSSAGQLMIRGSRVRESRAGHRNCRFQSALAAWTGRCWGRGGRWW